MRNQSWTSRTTRRRILELLRREPLTVRALASRLTLTPSAVRMHITEMERDGLVLPSGMSHGLNRPAAIYEVGPAAAALQCTAYVPFVTQLLLTLGEQLPASRIESLLQATGKRLAAGHWRAEASIAQRAQAASAFLNGLGAITDVEHADGRLTIRGYDCPLGAAVRERPEICRALEAVVEELVGTPVRERCERSGRPRCLFQISQGVEAMMQNPRGWLNEEISDEKR